MKPCYADEPPSPAQLRAYLGRLESSRSVRKSKQATARANYPQPRNQYAQRTAEHQQGAGSQLQNYLAPKQPDWTAQANKETNPLNPLNPLNPMRGPCHNCGMMGHFKREGQLPKANGVNVVESEHFSEGLHLPGCPMNQSGSSAESRPQSEIPIATCGADTPSSNTAPNQGN